MSLQTIDKLRRELRAMIARVPWWKTRAAREKLEQLRLEALLRTCPQCRGVPLNRGLAIFRASTTIAEATIALEREAQETRERRRTRRKGTKDET